ncbi:aminomethyltransferase folate-binding domain-containing protein [Rhizophagus clarus]|uniref:Aminomethyltransferase folate-binding domain-containing protein n=1 Tax=Rhizophagus clarus TaxID=94130 RepID=A0A8H3QEX9_9GLOM|nr:aminomethyltransferase folate-binding domain-containing protein [Rhizophagus clarus]
MSKLLHSCLGRLVSYNISKCSFGAVSSQIPLTYNTFYHKITYHKVTRSVSTIPTSEPSLNTSEKENKVHRDDNYAKVPYRGLIELHGDDTVKFLQGLITNNMPSISSGGDGFYSAFLNPVGRVLFDAFIYPKNLGTSFPYPTFLVECDLRIIPEIIKHMKKYLLRSKVNITDVSSLYQIWNIWGNGINNLWWKHQVPNPSATKLHTGTLVLKENIAEIGCRDERYPNMGLRLVLPVDAKPALSDSFTELPSKEYIIRRILHGVPEGIHDFPQGEALPLQSNFDYMGGIDFRKGCYIGQELTFRTYHTGITRKRILPVQLYHEGESVPTTLEVDRNSNFLLPPPSSDIIVLNRKGRPVGSIVVDNGHGEKLRVKAFIPRWWPKVDEKNIEEKPKETTVA